MDKLIRFTDFIFKKPYQAAGVVTALAFIPFIGISLSMMIAGFVTLRKGVIEGGLLTIAATLPAMYSWLNASPDEANYALIVVNWVILGNFSTWLFAAILRKNNNWGLLLESALLLGLAIILILHLLYPSMQVWWLGVLKSYVVKIKAALGGFQTNNSESILDDLQVQFITMVSYYLTGVLIAYTFFSVLTLVAMSRWWESVLYNPGSLRQELYRIRLSHVSGALFIVAFILSNFDNETVSDMMPLFYLIFGLAGLSLLHCLLVSREGGFFWLVLIYVFLIASFNVSVYAVMIGSLTAGMELLLISIALLTFIALLDTWMDLRSRFQSPLV